MGKAAIEYMDRAAELCGALALALGGAVSAWIATPMLVEARQPVALGVAMIGGALGWLFVRGAGGGATRLELPEFAIAAIEPEAMELAEAESIDDEVLILDQRVEAEAAPRRVVSLFGGDEVPTPGELQRRIAAHLSAHPAPPVPGTAPHVVPDASAALFEALAGLRRSLRQG
jgi:hypothetical protein